MSRREFDVAIGARVVSAEGRRIQVQDDDSQVSDCRGSLVIGSDGVKLTRSI